MVCLLRTFGMMWILLNRNQIVRKESNKDRIEWETSYIQTKFAWKGNVFYLKVKKKISVS